MIRGLVDRAFSYAGLAGGPAKAEHRLTAAYQQLFAGNGSKEDAEVVLSHLADLTGYYRRPSYAEWIAKTGSPAGFELHSALCNARAEVLQTMMRYLAMSEDEMVALEKAARLEGQG